MKLKINSIYLHETYGEERLVGSVSVQSEDQSVKQEIKLTRSTIESLLDIIEPLVNETIESTYGEASNIEFQGNLQLGMKDADAEVINSY